MKENFPFVLTILLVGIITLAAGCTNISPANISAPTPTPFPIPSTTFDPEIFGGVRLLNYRYDNLGSSITGNIKNENLDPVSVVVGGLFLDKNNVVIGQGYEYIWNLPPGQSSSFIVAYTGNDRSRIASCEVLISKPKIL